ncbi:MAG TPA: GNAT family N-acetyltransferase [Acidimicrobiales bacterium]|nr:GNAT family N-acetyltransferase [Acidimicrobiales bacterium]
MDDAPLPTLVEASVVRPLRHAVLRPGQPATASHYPEDDDPRTAHAAVRAPDVVAVGTVLCEAPPWEPGRPDAWRVRGMATRPDARGRGHGSAVLAALVDHARRQGGTLLWCNARVPARPLYERAGMAVRGEAFEVPLIGPHVRMWRALGGGPAT